MTTRNGQIKKFTSNFVPQHPAAHGVSRSVLEMNGEVVERAEPHIGSLQCGTKPLLDFPVEIRENSIQFLMEMDFCEFSPELEDHFEIFEHIRGFHVTILTSATHKMRLYHRGAAFFQKDEGESQ